MKVLAMISLARHCARHCACCCRHLHPGQCLRCRAKPGRSCGSFRRAGARAARDHCRGARRIRNGDRPMPSPHRASDRRRLRSRTCRPAVENRGRKQRSKTEVEDSSWGQGSAGQPGLAQVRQDRVERTESCCRIGVVDAWREDGLLSARIRLPRPPADKRRYRRIHTATSSSRLSRRCADRVPVESRHP